jgi:transketolase C-terminal domain/subunit
MTEFTPKSGYTTAMAVFETYDASVPTVVKPFGLTLIEAARRRSEIVGLTADLLARAGLAIKLVKIGIPDQFTELGSVPYLSEKYGLSVSHILAEARRVVED